jgi:hypothetical protein
MIGCSFTKRLAALKKYGRMKTLVSKCTLYRIVLLALFLVANGSILYSQQERVYRFTLQDIADSPSAKDVTDIIRPVFNTPEAPFAAFPWFDVGKGQFDFTCQLEVTREELETALAAYGLVLLEFTGETVESKTEER